MLHPTGMKRARILLLLATLSPVTVMHAQPRPTTLANLADHRALMVFSNGDNRLAEQQLTVAAEHVAEFRERDLVLVGLVGSNPAVPTAMLAPAEDVAARKRFHITPGQFTVVLVGKDGGEKLRSNQPISWNKLQSTIDAMPMRQNEMRRQGH